MRKAYFFETSKPTFIKSFLTLVADVKVEKVPQILFFYIHFLKYLRSKQIFFLGANPSKYHASAKKENFLTELKSS